MAILQALFAFVGRFAGKALNAIFGWAVRALFGETTPTEQTVLSGLVAMAVAWPLLVVGVIIPKTAALVLAFVPIPKWVPTNAVRLAWLVLALVVPLVVGLVVASKAPPGTKREGFLKRTLRGYPITIGLAGAFLIMFVSVPVLRIATILQRKTSISIPLVTDEKSYHEVAKLVFDVLNRNHFQLHPDQPGFWVTAPVKILLLMGGEAFRRYVPARLEHFRGSLLEVSLYPSGALLRGSEATTLKAHGLIAEAVVHSDALQTFAPAAQEIERKIRRVWHVYDENPEAHTGSAILKSRVVDIAKRLGDIQLEYEEWQVLYRQLLQLERALDGQPQLLEQQLGESPREGSKMSDESRTDAPHGSLPADRSAASMPLGQLVREVTGQVTLLLKKEVELARTELKSDLRSEIAMAKGLGVAAVTALLALNVLLVAAVLALALIMPGWAAALVVAGILFMIAGIAASIGWSKRVRTPLARTRNSIQEDVEWTKERLA